VAEAHNIEDRINPVNERVWFVCVWIAVSACTLGWKLPNAEFAPAIALTIGAILFKRILGPAAGCLECLLIGLAAATLTMCTATFERGGQAYELLAVGAAVLFVAGLIVRHRSRGQDFWLDPVALVNEIGIALIATLLVIGLINSPSWTLLAPFGLLTISYWIRLIALNADNLRQLRRRLILPLILCLSLLWSCVMFAPSAEIWLATFLAGWMSTLGWSRITPRFTKPTESA
jgi:hypothetical protein